jgi:hypothetical protein
MDQQELFQRTIKILDQVDIPYMVTGSFAVNFFGIPRTTHDIDFVIEIRSSDAERFADAFPRDFYADADMIRQAVASQSMFNIIDPNSGVKIDFWIVKRNPFDQERFRRRREQNVFGERVFMPTPEDTIISKLLWYQEAQTDKHLNDARGVWEIQQDTLDQDYLNQWVTRLGLEKEFEKVKKVQ